MNFGLKFFQIKKLSILLISLSLMGSMTACSKNPEAGLSDLKSLLSTYPKRDLENDPKVQAFLGNHKVYVSLTTSPARIPLIHHVLDTIDLTYITKVFLNLPLRFGRDGSQYPLEFQNPSQLRSRFQDKIRFIRNPQDFGPIMKLLPSIQYLKEQGDEDAILIIVDDDTGYPAGAVNEMIYQLVYNPGTVVAGSGQDLAFWGIDSSQFPSTQKNGGAGCSHADQSYCDVVEGFGSVGFLARYVDVDLMLKLSNAAFSRECFVSDDMVISFSLALSGIDRMRLHNPYMGTHRIHQYPYGFNGDALHQGAGLDQTFNGNEVKYRSCHQKLMELTFDSVAGRFKGVETIKREWNERYL